MELNLDLKEICKDIRCDIVTSIGHVGVGHIGGSLSIVELLAVLYFEEMNIDPQNPSMPGRDRFICSKGHAGPALYAALANRGYFDREKLLTLNDDGSDLPSHCDMHHTIGVDMTTGSLGQGFSCALGAALGSKLAEDGALRPEDRRRKRRRHMGGTACPERRGFARPPPKSRKTVEERNDSVLRVILSVSEGSFGKKSENVKAAPHNSARADFEKNCVLMKAVFRRNTLCIARKSDKIRARFFRKMPKADYAVLP